MIMKRMLFLILLFILLVSCKIEFEKSNFYNYYNFDKKTYGRIYELIQQKDNLINYDEIINWSNDVKILFLDNGKNKELVQFFGELSEDEKKSDIKDLINFIVSDFIWELGNKDIAVFYMLKVSEDSYSIEYNYNPIGYYIAKRIINSDSSNNIKKKMYDILLTNYKNIIDIPYTLYELSELYKKELDIANSLQIMKEILKYSGNNVYINENLSIYDIKNEINYHTIKKQWIYQDLETLVNNIKEAIQKRDKAELDSYVSKNDFIVELFQKESKFKWNYRQLDIQKKWVTRIDFSTKLEDFSNSNEAYLKTSNWGFIEMRVWYFYFKRVNYPYDIKVNNGWEWAGIYLGNPL